MNNSEIEHKEFLSGARLFGDDLSPDQLVDWYKSEEEGYAGIVANREGPYQYEYHALNSYHCYDRLMPNKLLNNVLGLGSAYGEEFKPILNKIKKITILDPSEVFANASKIEHVPCMYVKPTSSGDMPFEDDSFDLVTCFGVMHHIPNVTHVMAEIYRCLDKGGLFLIREPIVSQGDWRHARSGVTKNERGIPIVIFDNIIRECGFEVTYKKYCDFQPLPAVARFFNFQLYNNLFSVMFDSFISNALPWKKTYHRTRAAQKFSPASVVYILKKSGL